MTLFDYNLEPTLEAALISLLSANGLSAADSLGRSDLATPRVDVRFELGPERNSQTVTENTQTVSNTFDGQFVLAVVTDRDVNNASHSAYRASVRQILAESTAAQWEAALGARVRLLSLSHQTTAYNVLDSQTALDASVMTYNATLRLLAAS